MKLEEEISRLEGRLREYIDLDSIGIIKEQSAKKESYAFSRTNLKSKCRGLFYKIILLSDLETIFKYCFENNRERSNKEEVISKEFPLPKSGKFFKEAWGTPMYCAVKKDDATLKKEAVESLEKYMESFNLRKEEVSEAA